MAETHAVQIDIVRRTCECPQVHHTQSRNQSGSNLRAEQDVPGSLTLALPSMTHPGTDPDALSLLGGGWEELPAVLDGGEYSPQDKAPRVSHRGTGQPGSEATHEGEPSSKVPMAAAHPFPFFPPHPTGLSTSQLKV